jgi:Fe-S oxidoreductase
VVVLPTCAVEYHRPAIGKALVAVLEHHRIACDVVTTRCCGATSLFAGDVARFRAVVRPTVGDLADAARRGADIVVPQPSCASVLRRHAPRHLGTPEAALVATRTFDAVEYLARVRRDAPPDAPFDAPAGFCGSISAPVVYHAACHARTEGGRPPIRDLIELTGTSVTIVESCSGMACGAGVRATSDRDVAFHASRLTDALSAATAAAAGSTDRPLDRDAVVVVGDCSHANGIVEHATGRSPLHPLEFLALAYGVTDDVADDTP